MRTVIPLLFTIIFAGASAGAAEPEKETAAQAMARISQSLNATDRKILTDAFTKALEQGFQLGGPTVQDNVSVHTVLLPFDICRRVFGKEVADHYAAIELIVSNHSDEAALIVQSLHIDYSTWGLSGGLGALPRRPLKKTETGTEQAQIASVESRIVRGELLDAQPWTFRNVLIRSLRAAGSVAAGYQFAFQEQGIIRGIAAFNGQFIPAAEFLLPDGTTAQANRISDVGFQVNKVVPQQAAEVIVAFYPLARFLLPGLQDVFKKAPALFFAPASVVFDKKTLALLNKNAPHLLSRDELETIRTDLKAGKTSQNSPLIAFLNSFSLNTVRVLVGGVMAIDVDTIAPAIQDIEMDGGNTPGVWAEPGQKTGIISGRYLKNAEISILDADKYGITDVAAIPEGSTDTALEFGFKTSKPVPSGTILTITLTKKIKVHGKDKALISNPYLLQVDYHIDPPKIDSVERTGDKLVIKGANFFAVKDDAVQLKLLPSAAMGLSAVTVNKTAITRKPDQLEVDLTKVTLAPACWIPDLQVSSAAASGAKPFAQPANPVFKEAKVEGKRIKVTGEGFLDLSSCGSRLEFQVQQKTGGATAKAVKDYKLDSTTQASFDLPDPAAADWKVLGLVDGQQKASVDVEK